MELVAAQQIREPNTRKQGVSAHIDDVDLTLQFTIFPFNKHLKIIKEYEKKKKKKKRQTKKLTKKKNYLKV